MLDGGDLTAQAALGPGRNVFRTNNKRVVKYFVPTKRARKVFRTKATRIQWYINTSCPLKGSL